MEKNMDTNNHYQHQCHPKITFWNMQSCGNVLDTSSLITLTLASLLDGGSVVAERDGESDQTTVTLTTQIFLAKST